MDQFSGLIAGVGVAAAAYLLGWLIDVGGSELFLGWGPLGHKHRMLWGAAVLVLLIVIVGGAS